jgi:magnesium transporter
MLKQFQILEGKIKESADAQSAISIYINPSEVERKYLIEEVGADEHTISSALDPDEPARMEFEPNHIVLIIKRPKSYTAEDNFLFKVASLGMFIFAERLIIVLAEDTMPFDGRHFQRIRSIQDVVLKLIYSSILHFVGHLKVINMCTDQLEQQIKTAMENRHLLGLFTLEKSLVYYLNAISSNGRVIERLLANVSKIGMPTESAELLEDIVIENRQCYEQAQIYSQVLSSLMDARVSIVSNNLNVLMKRLNIIMVVLMVTTLWVSFFSMNVPLPFQEEVWMFWFIVLAAAISSIAVFLVKTLSNRLSKLSLLNFFRLRNLSKRLSKLSPLRFFRRMNYNHKSER